MSKKIVISVLLALGCISLFAQDYNRLVERNLWYTSSNAAGIRQDGGCASLAKLSAGYTGGGFHAYGDASSLVSAGASAYGIKQEKNFSMKGSFSFLQQNGREMFGPMLLNGERYPVNVYEFTPGEKKLQTYAFDGAISIDLGKAWRIGAGMEFSASNYAKFKDLRYVDYAMDMKFTPSAIYHCGRLALGANLILVKNSENPTAEQIGSTVSAYDAFIDKGLWFGVKQLWSGGGVHLKETGVSGFPVNEMGYGLGIQTEYNDFFLAGELLRTSGKVGEKQSIWFRFPGWQTKLNAGWKYNGAGGLHIIKAEASLRSMENNETILEKVSEGGVTTTVEHGSNLILQRRSRRAALSYSFLSGSYEGRARIGGGSRNELVSVAYPYLCWRKTSDAELGLEGSAKFGKIKILGIFQASAGWMEEASRKVNEASGSVADPFRLEEWNLRALEYELSPRINPALAVQYEITNGLSAAVNAGAICAFGLETIESPVRYSAGLGLIYKF